jgi:transposase
MAVQTLLSTQARHEPELARVRILTAYRAAGWQRDAAAKALGVSWRTLVRIVTRLRLAGRIARERAAAGVPAADKVTRRAG